MHLLGTAARQETILCNQITKSMSRENFNSFLPTTLFSHCVIDLERLIWLCCMSEFDQSTQLVTFNFILRYRLRATQQQTRSGSAGRHQTVAFQITVFMGTFDIIM